MAKKDSKIEEYAVYLIFLFILAVAFGKLAEEYNLDTTTTLFLYTPVGFVVTLAVRKYLKIR